MNAPAPSAILRAEVELLKPGMPFAGGFYTGVLNVNGQLNVIITADKARGDIDGIWNDSYSLVEGALSYCDGRANTLAMSKAGSELANNILLLEIEGFKDWYIPSQDELELQYRVFKPTADENYLYGRSGINVSAVPPTYPYTRELPTQTVAAAFQAGGEQAFEEAWHYSSTQHADLPDYAWRQHFANGAQSWNHESDHYRARAVRRLVIQ